MTPIEALAVFGVSIDDVQMRGQHLTNLEELVREIKQDCLKRYRKLSLEQHPDRGGEGEKMSELNQAMDIVRHLKLERRVTEPWTNEMVTYWLVIYRSGVTYTTTATAQATWWWPSWNTARGGTEK
jgi:hypothetical protein